VPNVVSAETQFMGTESYVCPWGATLPYVLRQSPVMRAWRGKFLCPTLRFRDGMGAVRKVMVEMAIELRVPKREAEQAFDAAWEALREFRTAYQQAGREALGALAESGEQGVVLVGRPYNLHDGGVSLSVGKKLRDLYGVNVIPIDALPLADVDVRDVNDNMFWEYGRRILAAGKLVKSRPNLHIIYITNFKCGPDSFIKSFLGDASGKPFLTLQFDGHSNDAGMMTRCEAYLDSKGILRWWRRPGRNVPQQISAGDGSTFHRCPVPAPG
jgi:predicted nucleotide-binding protein (sugar kinase/HSP70/actin superfamily)